MSESEPTAQKEQKHGRPVRAWGGYAWFMSFGTFLPLPVFVGGYLAQLTFVGAPLARRAYRFGIFLSTLGQRPPGADQLESRHHGDEEKKKPVRAAHPRPRAARLGRAARRAVLLRGPSCLVRLRRLVARGRSWTLLAWSVLLLPYPFPELIRKLLADLPSVMTLAPPADEQVVPASRP